MSAQLKPWFSEGNHTFTGNEPFFFDTDDYPWVKELEANWTVIRDELQALLAKNEIELQPYANKEMTSRADKWKTYGMMFWSFKSDENCERCPKTWELISKVPNLLAASFNLLEEHTTIKPHFGDTNAHIRCHMGLMVPGSAPQCAFRVGTETRSWEEGKFFMFCDAHEHTAWNNTNAVRYVLVLDILRPEFVKQRNSIISRVLSSIRLEVTYQNKPWLRKLMGASWRKQFMFKTYVSFFRTMLALGVNKGKKPTAGGN